MDARDIIAKTIKQHRASPDVAVTNWIICELEAAGYQIIHDSENHGPTLARAAEAVGNHNKTGREWVPGSLWDSITQEAVGRIRAMEERDG